jgi:hypothetical protein
VGVMLCIVRVIPFLHGSHGVVGSSQSFFGANCVDPMIDRFLVGVARGIQFGVLHAEQVNAVQEARQLGWTDFTKN